MVLTARLAGALSDALFRIDSRDHKRRTNAEMNQQVWVQSAQGDEQEHHRFADEAGGETG